MAKKEFTTITKQELLSRMREASDENLTQVQLRDAYEAFCYVVRKAIKGGEGVSIEGVGSINPVILPGREMINHLKGGDKIEVPDRLSAKFYLSGTFRSTLRECELPNAKKDEKAKKPNKRK